MKERPILFKDEMVRSILDGRKTQTRRIVKPQPLNDDIDNLGDLSTIVIGGNFIKCPYGHIGDRLWVRETWRQFDAAVECGCSEAPCNCPQTGDVIYRATHDNVESKWKPSIFMPRWASRITLEIKNVRVERLQDISEKEAIAEGVDFVRCPACGYSKFDCDVQLDHYLCEYPQPPSAINEFITIWKSINGADSWGKNPWVWVIDFERIT